MILLVLADIHFGKGGSDDERSKERELIACVEAYAASGEPLAEIVLLGDVFEHWIEYRHLVPKGFSRFHGLLARLSDAGVGITYLAGNHDPWHVDYFESEFGARFIADTVDRTINGLRYRFYHGDGVPERGGLYGRLRWLLRHPVPVGAYKTLLPGDVGVALARWVARRYSAAENIDLSVRALRQHATHLIESGEADVVIMGHSHYPEVVPVGRGLYVNAGSWHYQRTFALIMDAEPRLMRWTAAGALEVAGHRGAAPDAVAQSAPGDDSGVEPPPHAARVSL